MCSKLCANYVTRWKSKLAIIKKHKYRLNETKYPNKYLPLERK